MEKDYARDNDQRVSRNGKSYRHREPAELPKPVPDKTGISDTRYDARDRLVELLKNTPISNHELLTNMGLYLRSVILAKILYLNELYERILPLPGVIMEFGCWWGSNLALFASLRSIYEPYNLYRRVIGFDTFEGYCGISEKDTDIIKEGSYGVLPEYLDHIRDVLDCQESDNVQSHIKKYEIIQGDVSETLPTYLDQNPETIVSIAYFDVGYYKPNKACLDAIRPHLIRGSVLAMDHLNSKIFPGETLAFREVFGLDRYKVLRSRYLPDRSYVIVE